MKKTISLLLLIAMLASGLASCGNSAEETAADTAAADTAAAETTPDETALKPDIPDADLEGYSFRVYTRDTDHHIKEVYALELTGEVVNDAVYQRNLNVEEKYNVQLEAVEVTEDPESTMMNEFSRIVMAGEDAFDVALMHTVHAGSVAISGVAYNWNDVPYVDFEKPWWNSVIAEELNFNNMLFLAVSDYCISAIDYTWAMLYNRDMAEDNGIGDLYDTVEEGAWDFDTFNTLARTVAVDTNGDGVQDYNDQYGYVTHFNSATLNWAFAFDMKYIVRDENDEPYILPQSDKMMDITEKIYSLYFESGAAMYCSDAIVKDMGKASHDLAVADFFKEGKSLFAALRIYVIDNLRDMEGEFGIIPFPKYDQAQEAYYTHVDGHAPLMILPKTLQNTENAGLVMEALAYESNQLVVPAVYEIVLQSKYARDEASSRMLDLILDGRVYTFGYMYDNWKGMQWTLTNLMSQKSKDYASYYAKQLKSAETQLKAIIESYQKIEENS
ncbi:MAG: hypothetical protein IJ480_03975 [Clostridia bacterium]|nr:hypothetical protein [Clostridia bacterium]